MTATSAETTFDNLPLNLRIAFAARCAQRMEQFLEAWWPALPLHRRHLVREVVEATERSEHDGTAALAYDPSSFLELCLHETLLPKAAALSAILSAFLATRDRSPTHALQAVHFAVLALNADRSPAAHQIAAELDRDHRAVMDGYWEGRWLEEEVLATRAPESFDEPLAVRWDMVVTGAFAS